MILKDVYQRFQFCLKADRLGPDIIFTHWKLHFPRLMRKLCKLKFKAFGLGAEFRPGAYAIGCSKISLGRNVIIRPQSMLFADTSEGGAGITIEDEAMVGSGVHMYTANHAFQDPSTPIYYQGHSPSRPIILRRGCWVGANSVLLSGVEVGENAVVSAGSIVTKSVPAFTVVGGNPARVLVDLSIK